MFIPLISFPKNTSYIRFLARSYANLAVNTKVNTQINNTTPKSSKEETSSSTISSITPGECNVNFV